MQFPVSITPDWRRRVYGFTGAVLAVWVLAWLAVPPLVHRLIEQQGSQALGRTVTVGAVAFRPWSLELTVSDLAVAMADGSGPQLVVGRLYADVELVSLLHMAPVLDAITVEQPTLRLIHKGDGRYDVDDILERLNKAPEPASGPIPFALYNLSLHGGSVDFTDQLPAGARQHAVRALHLALPFLSTLDSKRDVKVVPRLAFELNGSAFDTAAEGTPFAQTHKGAATLKITHLDLAPYLPYLPQGGPLRLSGAVVDADLRLGFEQSTQSRLSVAGRVQVSGLALGDAAGQPVLGVESLVAELSDVRPLDRTAQLAALEITGPRLQVVRDVSGRIKLLSGMTGSDQAATKNIAASAYSTGATGQKDSQVLAKTASKAWTLGLERLVVNKGAVGWTDDSTRPQARLTLDTLALQAHGLRWPLAASSPMRVDGSARLMASGKAARLAFNGEATAARATGQVSLADAELALAAPYLSQALHPAVSGVLDAELNATWSADSLQFSVPRLTVRDFALTAGKEQPMADTTLSTGAQRAASEMPRFKLLEITAAQFDWGARTASVGKLALRSPSFMAHRNTGGQWTAQTWLKTAVPETTTAPPDTPTDTAPGAGAATAGLASAWQVSVGELAVDDATLKLDDRSLARPVRLELSALKLQLNNATLEGNKPAPLSLSARVKAGRTEPGSLNYRGTLMWAPLVVQGTLDAQDIPLHAVTPYVADQLNLAVLRADTSYRGEMRYAAGPAGTVLQLNGDASLDDFRANTVVAAGGADAVPVQGLELGVAEELLSWKSLQVPGIDLRMAPGSATRLQVREASLSDFFARVIVFPTGRVNLQDLVKGAPQPNPARTDANVAATAVQRDPLAAIVSMGPITLVNGKVLFSDRFIRPNYSADITELSGTLSQFSSQTADGKVPLADLALKGRAEGSASLEVTGKINPLAQPLALDIKGSVRDLDLPPLTAYSVKYAGYGIERGKLSMDVTYTVQPDGQLTANNNLILNQLSFGDKVEGAPNSLPVKLAVALLADRDGVIELNLPISGSLNDPDFRIGAVVWKVITNLIGKALTAPFSLIAHAFGGGSAGDALSAVVFEPGSSGLTADAKGGLDTVAKALAERPVLQVTVVGTASLDTERDALKRERLRGLMLGEKRRRAAVTGQDVASAVALSDAERPALLKDVYRRVDITKPRNVLGLAKDIPDADMEALLLASITVSEDSMRELALQRGVAVKDYLASRKLGAERLFLGAPKIVASAADWKPRAELNVTSR